MDQRAPGIDAWLWAIAIAVLLCLRVAPTFAPALNQDSFQYLFAAKSALAGHAGYTALIHYDVERSFGTLPAPLLTFPLGYPLAIAGVSLAGFAPATAALLLSLLATIGCVPLLAWLGARLQFSRGLRNMVIACFVLNGVVSEFGTAAMTEALFTFLVLLGIVSMFAARLREGRSDTALWIAAGLAIGAAYFVRYAGLFFIFGVSLLAVRYALARNRRLLKGHLITLAIAVLFVMSGVVRNLRFVGNWHGRDEMLSQNPVWPAVKATATGMNALFLGVGTGGTAVGGTFLPKLALCAFLVLGLAMLAWLALRARPAPRSDAARPSARIGQDLLILTAAYAAGMFYAGLRSEISYGLARNFVPMVSLLLLLFGWLLNMLLSAAGPGTPLRRAALGALLLSFACYAYLNLLVMHLPLQNQTAAVLDRIGPPGASARETILKDVGPHGVIMANNGQAVGYVLGTPTISMVGHIFAGIDWNEATVRDTVKRFGVSALVISAPIPGNPSYDEVPSPFIGQLIQGAAPSWLRLEYRANGVLVYAPVLTGDPATASRAPA